MAPETIESNGKLFTEQTDVYSFGLCLYEILTGEQVYKELRQQSYSSDQQILNTISSQICQIRLRPKITDNISEKIRDLIEKCWSAQSVYRPTFQSIIKTLTNSAIETVIDDPVGREFWGTNFPGRSTVEWAALVKCLCNLVKCEAPDLEAGSIIKRTSGVLLKDPWYCFKTVLEPKKGKIEDSGDIVTVESFGHALAHFGPLLCLDGMPFLNRIQSIISQPWFHGDISGEDATILLQKEAEGMIDAKLFLVRYSSKAGMFALSKIKGKDVTHIHITRSGAGFELSGVYYSTWQSLFGKGFFGTPCPGSKYQPRQLGAYGCLPDDMLVGLSFEDKGW